MRRRPSHNFLDRLFVFHPHPWIERDWARISGLPLQDVWFESAGGLRLFGWYVEAKGAPAVLLWCHGNAGNLIHRLENLAQLYTMGISVFLFDYRGYGQSQGVPSEEGFYQDALAAYGYLAGSRRVRPERLVIFGRSLGAAAAGDLAARRPLAGLILESAFPSVGAVARAHYFGLPVDWLLSSQFNLADRVRTLSIPKLFIHGDRDEIIPIELGKQVFEAAREPKSFYVVPGADHNDLYQVGGRPYFKRLRQFIEDVVR